MIFEHKTGVDTEQSFLRTIWNWINAPAEPLPMPNNQLYAEISETSGLTASISETSDLTASISETSDLFAEIG